MKNEGLPIVVVPDGISITDEGYSPSFVYRAVLDYLMSNFANNTVYLAPANSFGTPFSEQNLANDYISKNENSFNIIWFEKKSEEYIDTYHNALYLREYLEKVNTWPIDPIILLSGRYHSKRASMVFKKVGFNIFETCSIKYKVVPSEKIVRRLFYYKHPMIHRFYELFALFRDFLIY